MLILATNLGFFTSYKSCLLNSRMDKPIPIIPVQSIEEIQIYKYWLFCGSIVDICIANHGTKLAAGSNSSDTCVPTACNNTNTNVHSIKVFDKGIKRSEKKSKFPMYHDLLTCGPHLWNKRVKHPALIVEVNRLPVPQIAGYTFNLRGRNGISGKVGYQFRLGLPLPVQFLDSAVCVL